MYTLDESGRIDFPQEILADGDQQVLATIRAMKRNFRKCEVWNGHRMVAALNGGVDAR
jgi:hypothetical protein